MSFGLNQLPTHEEEVGGLYPLYSMKLMTGYYEALQSEMIILLHLEQNSHQLLSGISK